MHSCPTYGKPECKNMNLNTKIQYFQLLFFLYGKHQSQEYPPLRPFGVPPCFSPRNRSLAFVVPCHVANRSLECSKATMVDGGKNLMERFGLEITFIIILLSISSLSFFSDEVSTLTIHFSNIHYPSFSIKLFF